MLFGIDCARQAIWQRRQKEVAEARAEGQEEGIEVGREEGYRLGFDAGVAEERRRRNGANGHNWMFGGPDDYC
jgi:flagellar biosynthesis/type III secretory pathway protein FliH